MKEDNVILAKSYFLAVKIVKTYRIVIEKTKDYTLARQLLKSGTSIGANIEEAVGGQSRADFIAKISIAYKESREALFWVRLLKNTQYLDDESANSLIIDIKEIQRILSSILTTTKRTNSCSNS